ncbi:hypothetical protein ACYOEI_07030 [Singulisphaera rosea]
MALSLGVLASGCAEELGPPSLKTTRLEGLVTVGGQPVGGGWVEFTPIEGTVGKLRSARIGSDGKFVVDRVAVGRNSVGVVDAPIDPKFTGMFHPFSTPIHLTIADGSRVPLSVDLLEEAVRFDVEKKQRERMGSHGRP